MTTVSGFWTGDMLARRQQQSPRSLISPFNVDRLERASYNLSVGDEIFVSPASDADYKTKRILKDREACIIPPGQFALMTTAERIYVPSDAIAFISLRSKATKFKGLVNVSGFHVDPGYDGVLIFTVFNAGPAPIHVARGDKWFEILFASLGEPSHPTRDKKGFTDLPTELLSALTHQFLSLPGLDAKIDSSKKELEGRVQAIEREHAISRWALGVLITGIVALGVRSCSMESRPSSAATAAAIQGTAS